MLNRYTLLVCVQAAALIAAPAERLTTADYGHRLWRTEDGLPQNRIRAISQTPDGYLWIGTSEGLTRFDGVRFTVFDRSNTPAIHDDGILVLRLAYDGALWIGTEGGALVRYKAGVFRNFGTAEGLTNGFVRAIYEDSRKTLWVGTDRGFFRREGERFVRLDNTAEVPHATVPSIVEDAQGRIWAVNPMGLLTLADGKLGYGKSTCDTTRVRGLRPSRSGMPWVISITGGGHLRDGCIEPDLTLPQVTLRTIVEDHEGTVWVGTTGRGLFRMANGKLAPFPAIPSLPDETVNTIFEDSEHNLWVGCEAGLLRISRSSVTNVGTAEGLDDDNVLTVYSAPTGELWLTTLNGHIYRMAGLAAKRYRLPAPAENIEIRTVFQERSGTLWFGSFLGGVVRQAGSTAAVYNKTNGLRANVVRQILEDRAGVVWLALDSGLASWNGHSFRNYYLEDGLSYPSSRCMIEDDRGDLLVGTDGGLNRVHNGNIVRDNEFASVANEKIWAIYRDPAGTLWLGTQGGGLLRLKSGALTRFTRTNGLPSNTIFQILDDRRGNLWMSTSSGVISAERKELDDAARGNVPSIHITPYGTADGMITSQMNGGIQPAGARTASGDLWFPSVKGAVRINPVSVPGGGPLPVLMESLIADSQSIPLSDHVSIPPGHARVEIDFTLCDLMSPQRVSFQYKLEGFDENWTTAVRTRSASYTNLPHGDYRFHVLASDPGLPSKNSEAVLSFTLMPAFYATKWFFALVAMALGTGIWGGFALYARQTRLRYGLVLAERTRLAREMHDTVIQGCVGTDTLLEAAAGFRTVDPAEADNLMDEARVQVKKTLEEARQAVWDLRNPPPAESSIPVLFELAQKLGSKHRIQIETAIDGTGSLAPDTDRTILLVGREAVSNAVAHANASRISIRLSYEMASVTLEVTDDGRGFAVQREGSAESRHFGLIGMRERVEAAGGSFAIRSRLGEGTTVIATLPATAAPIVRRSLSEAP